MKKKELEAHEKAENIANYCRLIAITVILAVVFIVNVL